MTLQDILAQLNANGMTTTLAFNTNQFGTHARFPGIELKADGCLRSAYGTGRTEQEASADYLKQLRGACLVYKAYSPERRELVIPSLMVDA